MSTHQDIIDASDQALALVEQVVLAIRELEGTIRISRAKAVRGNIAKYSQTLRDMLREELIDHDPVSDLNGAVHAMVRAIEALEVQP